MSPHKGKFSMNSSLLSFKVNTAANISFSSHRVALAFISFTALTVSYPTCSSSGFPFLKCLKIKRLLLRGFFSFCKFFLQFSAESPYCGSHFVRHSWLSFLFFMFGHSFGCFFLTTTLIPLFCYDIFLLLLLRAFFNRCHTFSVSLQYTGLK